MEQYEYAHLEVNQRLYGNEYSLKGTVYQDMSFLSVLKAVGCQGWQLVGQDGRHHILMRKIGWEG